MSRDETILFDIVRAAGFPPLAIDPDDLEMKEAFQRARATMPELRHLLQTHSYAASVKFPFVTSSGETEHLWAEVIEVMDNSLKVRLVAPPLTHEGLMERVHVKSLDDIESWQVAPPARRIEEGFIHRVMLKRAREQWGELPDELAKEDKNLSGL